MTKLSFINNNPDDRRLTIRKLSKESTITIPARDNLANHYVDAVIGAGNRPMTNSQA